MKIVVHKYGGSSLSTPEKIKGVAQKVVSQKRAGYEVAVIVSAMGNTTDKFLDLARAITDEPPSRELDILLTAGEQISMSLLSMAIAAAGEEAVSLTGSQAGIVTSPAHNRASILEIRPHRVQAELGQGKVPVVAGFQGLSYTGEVTTLGRGGSDTSAVALAAALGAERCDIYSDVDGVYSSDPRLVPGARRIAEIGYEEMQEMARHGARVLNASAVEFARRSGLEIRACSTFQDGPGTLVRQSGPDSGGVIGVTGRADLLLLKMRDPAIATLLRPMLEETELLREHRDELLLTADNVADPGALCQRLLEEFRSKLEFSSDLGSVSVIGSGLGSCPDSALRADRALRQHGLAPVDSFGGPLSMTCLLPTDAVQAANRILHEEFFEQGASA